MHVVRVRFGEDLRIVWMESSGSFCLVFDTTTRQKNRKHVDKNLTVSVRNHVAFCCKTNHKKLRKGVDMDLASDWIHRPD